MAKYDAFISYAAEDKEEVVDALYQSLKKRGIEAYYAGFELRIGDEIESVILKGLKASKYGILVISPDFLKNPWPLIEMAKLLVQKKNLFPVWHKVGRKEVGKDYRPLLDYWSISTSVGMEGVAQEIADQIKANERNRLRKWVSKLMVLLVVALSIAAPWYFQEEDYPNDLDILNHLQEWSECFDKNLEGKYFNSARIDDQHAVRHEQLKNVMKNYNNSNATGYNNIYRLDNGVRKVSSKKGALEALDMSASMADVFVGFGMSNYKSYLYTSPDTVLVLINQDQVEFELLSVSKINNNELEVRARCFNHIRMVEVHLTFPANSQARKKAMYYLHALWSLETFRLKKKQTTWAVELMD